MAKQIEFFRLLDHACRICGGRLLSREKEDGRTSLRCSECGASADALAGADSPHRLVCYCGAKLMTGVDARLRCRRNDAISPELSQEVLVMHLPDEAKPKKPAKSTPRSVQSGGGFEW